MTNTIVQYTIKHPTWWDKRIFWSRASVDRELENLRGRGIKTGEVWVRIIEEHDWCQDG